MEDLTKTQLILLALLVSFITSIATGIVTITLLDQAPPGVTQTINRVVERTVEKVVPGQAASVVTKETTVVIKEENLIIDAVEKNSKNIVRIGLPNEEGELSSVLGIGVIISSDGSIVTDILNLSESDEYLVKGPNGKIHSANIELRDQASGLAFLEIVQEAESENPVKFVKPSFGDAGDLKLGQTVIAIGGLSENTILTGIVSRLNKKTVSIPAESVGSGEENSESQLETEKVEVLNSVTSNISFSSDYSGGPLLDVDGFLVGINMKRKDGDFATPIGIVLDIIAGKLNNTEKVEG